MLGVAYIVMGDIDRGVKELVGRLGVSGLR